ncbi:SIR2 family protein [Pseudoalteromonas phenolica]|uniref:SIR2 family protein n=1 Tax=Pseudoalteromonas phenolica TaxID=161398 RepID=UPI00110A99F6|nr:SIR2 family protein [Pseudoalteromonas phenolica]TMO56361.1 hypothetical protein CWC21_06575 [Pseudoalteromonas phenolica]
MDIIKELADSFKADTVLFIGSGVSRQAGLPSWEGLLYWLKDYTSNVGGSVETAQRLIKNKQFLEAASELVYQLTEVGKTLADFFAEFNKCELFSSAEPVAIHQLLNQLPTKFYITPNYDLLLEKSFGLNGRATVINRGDSDSIEALLHGELNNYIYKYHGCISSPENVVLTDEDYRKEIHGFSEDADCLRTLIRTKTFVFVGAGLDDPDFKFIRDELIHYRGANRLKVWAFMSDCIGDEEFYARQHGINLINYDTQNDGSDHSDLLTKIEELLSKIIARDKSKESAAKAVVQEPKSEDTGESTLRQVLAAANEEITPLDEQILGFVSLLDGVERTECEKFLVRFKGNTQNDVNNRIEYLTLRGLLKQTQNYLLPVRGRYSAEAAVIVEDDVMEYVAERAHG